jgi:hypothetical protein
MIVGDALSRVFKGQTVNIVPDGGIPTNRVIQFHYGNQSELIKWTKSKTGAKYPLVWYVISPVISESNLGKEVKSQLILLTDTKLEWLNSTKVQKTYNVVIEPLYAKVQDLLLSNPFIQVSGDRNEKFQYIDQPSFGIETKNIRIGQTDFAPSNQKSITLDVVDARLINIHLIIKTNCL